MAFNFKAFAAGFMDDQARQINERVAEARQYKRELKENAEASKNKISKLKQLKGLAASEIARIRALGVDDEYINAAIASGPKGLFDLSTALQEEASRRNFRPGQKFDKFEVESLIDITENFKYGDVDSQEFYEMNTALTKPSLGSTKDSKRGLFGTLLGLDLDDAVRARLDEDAYFDGYSVMDINELAKQEAYESVAPGTYFSFAPTQAFDASKALSNFNLAVSRIESDLASDSYQATVLTQAQQLIDTNPDYADKDQAELAALLTDREKNKRIFSQATILANNNPRFVEELQPVLENYGMDESAIEALRFDVMTERELERNLANLMLEKAPAATGEVGQRMKFTARNPQDGTDNIEVVVTEGDVVSLKVNGNPLDTKLIPAKLKQIQELGGISSFKAAQLVTDTKEIPVVDTPPPSVLSPETTVTELDPEEKPEEKKTTRRERPIDKLVDFFSGRGEGLAEARRKAREKREGKDVEEDTTPVDDSVEVEYTRDNPYIFEEGLSNEEAQAIFNSLLAGTVFRNPADGEIKVK
tara:strand:+ start:169 stop:1764 length:1596 start_codon:yes stop_codon:yes gene_type:complete